MEEGSLAKLIADGFSSSSKHSFGKTLNDEQITDLVAFIMSW
jgi:mono/diheme cytochrome c family protein